MAGTVVAGLVLVGAAASAGSQDAPAPVTRDGQVGAGAGTSATASSPATPPSPVPTEPAEDTALAPPAPEGSTGPAAVAVLLTMAAGGDGDSWRDTRGTEYRMGLIDAPESRECGGSDATAYRKRALAGGFRAEVYATDRYGRNVAVILTPDGTNLNLAMARDGMADDRYLEQFRHENPVLAGQLDAAFAEAKRSGRGIWSGCATDSAPQAVVAPLPAQQPPAPTSGCHPDYVTCIPVKGDGSGRGQANDLDCGDLAGSVRLRTAGVDPYRLDADGDGVGCD